MQTTGMIIEYNPLHNGHLYLLEETRRIDLADLKKELTPCTRMAERATVPFILSEWKNHEHFCALSAYE